MKFKPVIDQIFSFLQQNPSVHHGGDIQRMLFKTRRDGYATGDSIKRRLNELVEDGKVLVTYNEKNEAMFSIKEGFEKKEFVAYVTHPLTGERMSLEEYRKL